MQVKDILENKSYNVDRDNVHVKENNITDVYNDDVAQIIRDALDKPKAIGEILADKLQSPDNVKLYIKLAYQLPHSILFECVALTNEAAREGKITHSRAQYFYGIVKNKLLVNRKV